MSLQYSRVVQPVARDEVRSPFHVDLDMQGFDITNAGNVACDTLTVTTVSTPSFDVGGTLQVDTATIPTVTLADAYGLTYTITDVGVVNLTANTVTTPATPPEIYDGCKAQLGLLKTKGKLRKGINLYNSATSGTLSTVTPTAISLTSNFGSWASDTAHMDRSSSTIWCDHEGMLRFFVAVCITNDDAADGVVKVVLQRATTAGGAYNDCDTAYGTVVLEGIPVGKKRCIRAYFTVHNDATWYYRPVVYAVGAGFDVTLNGTASARYEQSVFTCIYLSEAIA